MASFSSGKHALMISDRSGVAFPYREMVQEWTGMWVHTSEFEPKQPQLEPRPIVEILKDYLILDHQEKLLQLQWF